MWYHFPNWIPVLWSVMYRLGYHLNATRELDYTPTHYVSLNIFWMIDKGLLPCRLSKSDLLIELHSLLPILKQDSQKYRDLLEIVETLCRMLGWNPAPMDLRHDLLISWRYWRALELEVLLWVVVLPIDDLVSYEFLFLHLLFGFYCARGVSTIGHQVLCFTKSFVNPTS